MKKYIKYEQVKSFVFQLLSAPNLKDIVKTYKGITDENKDGYKESFMAMNFNIEFLDLEKKKVACEATCRCGNIFMMEHEWLENCRVASCDKCRKNDK